MASLFSGLIGDLENARKSSLLIEVQQKHVDEILKEQPNFELKNYCNSIFNQKLPPLKTNAVFIDASPNNQAQVLHAVFYLIEDSLKRKKEIDSALKLGLYCATLGLSEFVDSSITDNVSNYIDGFLDEGISKWLGTKAEDQALNKAEEAADQIINTSKAHYLPRTTLYLAKAAKQKLTSLTDKLNVNHSPSEAMQFMVELVATLGEDAPKLIVINDPYSLDAESLSFCSLLLSYAKDLKQQGQVMPLSLVFNYTSMQPYDNDSKIEKNFQPLLRLRHMTQRYDMLEKPDANIPSPAIKSTTFVGRQDELKQLEQQHDNLLAVLAKNENELRCQWTLVKGEPGTGKTALINTYLSELEKRNDGASKSQIRLRLLNQVGHSSQVTGLASLLQSIHAEANRLTLCYEQNNGWLKKYINRRIKETFGSAKDIYSATQKIAQGKEVTSEDVKKALKAISSIANKDTLYASAEAIYDRKKISKSKAQSADAFSDGAPQNKKQEEFDKIASALRHLHTIAVAVSPENKKMPIILVIDDLQWIDELSAEFVLEHLVGKYPIEFLITSRDSDSKASYKLAQARSVDSTYTLKIFEIANLVGPEGYFPPERIDNVQGQQVISSISLRGMDRDTVVDLLNEVYEIEDGVDVEKLANALIQCLAANEGNENQYVNTLFVIEALNLLSDSSFYHRYQNVAPLFIKCKKNGVRLNITQDENVEKKIKHVFKYLRRAHKNAYTPESLKGSEKLQFSLASYAVLEERLLIIAQYLGKESKYVCFGLKLSAIIGEPFDSKLVNSFLKSILAIERTDYPSLKKLKSFLNEGGECRYDASVLDVLEEAFEIVKRMRRNDDYIFKHGLFRTYLTQKFTEDLSTANVINIHERSAAINSLPERERIDYLVKEKFYDLDDPLESFTEVFLRATFFHFQSISSNQVSYAHQKVVHNFLEFVSGYHVFGFNEQYFDLFNCKVNDIGKQGCADILGLIEVRKMNNKAKYLLKYIYLNNPERWAGRYAATLFNQGMGVRLNRGTETLEYFEEACKIVKLGYEQSPENWQDGLHLLLDRIGLECRHPSTFTDDANIISECLVRANEVQAEYDRLVQTELFRKKKSKKCFARSESSLDINLTSFATTSLNLEDAELSDLELRFKEEAAIFEKVRHPSVLARIMRFAVQIFKVYERKNMKVEMANKSDLLANFCEELCFDEKRFSNLLRKISDSLQEIVGIIERNGCFKQSLRLTKQISISPEFT